MTRPLNRRQRKTGEQPGWSFSVKSYESEHTTRVAIRAGDCVVEASSWFPLLALFRAVRKLTRILDEQPELLRVPVADDSPNAFDRLAPSTPSAE